MEIIARPPPGRTDPAPRPSPGIVELSQLIARYSQLDSCREEIAAAVQVLRDVVASGKKLLVCGNGGSAADSEHIVGELMKGFLKKRPVCEAFRGELKKNAPQEAREIGSRLQGAFPAMALTSQISLSTAISNDTDASVVFAQQVYGLGQPGDALLEISTSAIPVT
jgi:D-sedoheptulose 7-phosphate isomerase